MVGSILIKENDCEKIKEFSIESANKFTTLELNVLLTLDFEMKVSESDTRWADGEPVFFSEENGSALFSVNSAGIDFLLSDACNIESHEADDIDRLRKFVEKNGNKNIYEFATF